MSITGRFVIDRLKRAVSSYVRLPVPPYGTPNYWESSYQKLTPYDVNEWGVNFEKLKSYRYKHVPLSSEHLLALGSGASSNALPPSSSSSSSVNTKSDDVDDKPGDENKDDFFNTTFGETIRVYAQASKDEPILIIGCGNSKLGEDMIDAKWRGPVIQLDVASRVVDSMSIRCANYLPNGSMQIVQDDATLLSAIADGKVNAVIDKGLVDALFCADEYAQVADILRATHRVLEPGGCLVTFSFSHPDFFLTSLLTPPHRDRRRMVPWESVDIRQLDTIYLYRFTKKPDKAVPSRVSKKSPKGRYR